jgi:HEPN domain-containing protein
VFSCYTSALTVKYRKITCQQAVEKYLKAFLTKHKISFQKTHDLLKLYLQVKEVKNLYIESRYPTDIALLEGGLLPSVEKSKTYLDFAKSVAKIVKAELEDLQEEKE